MLIEIKVPQLSESVSEATLVSWHKQEGQAVKRDENLIDVETDKVVLELPAPADGVITKIIKANGSLVGSMEVIAMLDTEAVAAAGAAPAAAPAAAKPAAAAAAMSPAASKIAAEKGLSADQVAGTGRDGRITKGDVLAAGSGAAPAAPAKAPAAPVAAAAPLPAPPSPVNLAAIMGGRPEQRVPMTRLRARVAERLLQAQSTAAMLTTFNEVNMQPVMDLRNKYKDKFEKEHSTKLGFMSFFVKATVAALKKFPVVNASVDGSDIVYHGYFDIGIAVGSDRGLVVPILRNADQMSISEIEAKIAEYGRKAKDGKLTIEELTGGTFSITNGGIFGSMMSTPILNPPQSAIMGMHAIKDRPVVENGQVVVRPMMYLALTYDHRIIDGREAVQTLVTIKDALEDPARLLLEV